MTRSAARRSDAALRAKESKSKGDQSVIIDDPVPKRQFGL